MPIEMYINMIFALDNEFCSLFAEFKNLCTEFVIVSSLYKTDFEKAADAI